MPVMRKPPLARARTPPRSRDSSRWVWGEPVAADEAHDGGVERRIFREPLVEVIADAVMPSQLVDKLERRASTESVEYPRQMLAPEASNLQILRRGLRPRRARAICPFVADVPTAATFGGQPPRGWDGDFRIGRPLCR